MAARAYPCHVLLLGHDPDVAEALRTLFAEDQGCLVTDLATASDSVRFLKASDAPVVVLLGLDVPPADLRFLDVLGVSLEPYHHERHVFVGLSTNPVRLDAALRHRLAEWRIPVVAMPFEVDDLLGTVAQLQARAKETLT